MFLLPGLAWAQENRVEQLKHQITTAPEDTAKVGLLCELSREYRLSDVKKSMEHAKSALALAKRLHYAKGEAKAIGLIGNGHLVLGEFDKAFPNYFTSLRIGQELKDTALLVSTYNSLGILCFKTNDEKRALQYYNKSFELALKTNNQSGLARVYNNQGDIYESRGEFSKALAYYQKAANIQQKLGDKKSYAVNLLNIGNLYNAMGKPAQGLPFLFKALQLDEEINNLMNMTVTLRGIATSYVGLRQLDTALKYALKSYEVAEETESGKKIVASARLLAEIYASKGEYQQAYHYQQAFARQDSVLDNERQNRVAAEIIARYETKQKDLENLELKAQKRLQEAEIRQQEITLMLGWAVLGLMLLVVGGLYLSRQHFRNISRQLREATSLLTFKNEQITAQKEEICRQSKSLQQKNAQLDRHNSFKNKIFSIVSHDLRAPFSSIQGILQLVQNRTLTEGEVKRIFETLGRNMEVMVNMMNNLLAWSKAQMKGSALEMQPLNLHEFAGQSLEVVYEQAQAKQVKLHNQVSPDLMLFTDKERLAFVLRNLLSNAIKFCFESGEITLSARKAEAGVVVKVQDTGKGISERNLAKLFSEKRFTTPGTFKEEGTGLGLMLCKELVESLGGEITVQSVENQGSTFIIFLPCVVKNEQVQELENAVQA
ncbi:tetratricopeptide repeat-containing sensor histidine kinase [Sabulibacter ruber]|uniref:ATP-binding protein n=1 Tax=Sabulibacter ruber TaxID=2811901 RepID=UPI001A9796A1|nr:tetratricopeptide repeat-containing sensor histidine kinase [Sabulibacter ruber]